MSVNIPDRVARISDVHVTVHIANLTTGARRTFERVLNTGIATSNGLPARLAMLARRQRGRPVLQIAKKHLSWYGDVGEVGWTALTTTAGAVALSGEIDAGWRQTAFDKLMTAINDRELAHNYPVPYGVELHAGNKIMPKKTTLTPWDYEVPTVISYNAQSYML